MSSAVTGKRNPPYGKWSEKDTNWSDSDTKLIEQTLRKNQTPVPASLKKYEEKLALLKKR